MRWRDRWELKSRRQRRQRRYWGQRRLRLFVRSWRLIFFVIWLFMGAANTRRRFNRWYRRYLPVRRHSRRLTAPF